MHEQKAELGFIALIYKHSLNLSPYIHIYTQIEDTCAHVCILDESNFLCFKQMVKLWCTWFLSPLQLFFVEIYRGCWNLLIQREATPRLFAAVGIHGWGPRSNRTKNASEKTKKPKPCVWMEGKKLNIWAKVEIWGAKKSNSVWENDLRNWKFRCGKSGGFLWSKFFWVEIPRHEA